jgi:hypothetical protein
VSGSFPAECCRRLDVDDVTLRHIGGKGCEASRSPKKPVPSPHSKATTVSQVSFPVRSWRMEERGEDSHTDGV